MVGEQLNVVVASLAERLDPLGCLPVALGSLGTRNLPIRDVAEQDVAERVLRLARDRRPPLTAEELLPLEGTERRFELLAVGHRCNRADPEDLPVHGCALQQLLLL